MNSVTTRWWIEALKGAGAATLLLWLPFLIFLKHNAYPLVSPEIMAALGLMALAGLFWGLLMTVGGTVGRVVVVTFLAVMVVDVQTDWITTWGLRLLLSVLVLGTLAWFVRRRLIPVVILLAGLMVLGTVVGPTGQPLHREGGLPGTGITNPDLPFVLHIILDEHIGIEGIPAEFDPDRQVASLVRDSYLDLGFTVFGRAYSRYYNTEESLGNALNFTASPKFQRYYPPSFRRGALLEENAWMDLLQDRGYRVHVLQSDFMTFHRPDGLEGPRLADGSLTFPSETVGSLGAQDIPALEKTRFILGSYQRLSFFLGMFREAYGSVRRSGVGLPDWDESGDRLSILSALEAVDLLEEELRGAGPGQAFLVHLLLPHYPYAFDPDCKARPMSGTWLNADDRTKLPRRNDTESRELRYPLYLAQLECANARIQGLLAELARQPWWDEAVVIVHGDHGSRIDRGPPVVPTVDAMEPQDFMDAYSTLFAVKSPVVPPGYDRRQLPLDHLLGSILRDEADPGDPALERRPWVWIRNGKEDMIARDLPFFAFGLPARPPVGSDSP